MRIRFCIGLSLLALLASYGCGGSAELEMKEAQRAMDKAKDYHAADLAPADFHQAEKTWARAQTVAKEGDADTAKVLFASSKIYFNKSAAIAKSKQDALSRELGGMQHMISSNFKEVQRDISKNNLPPARQIQVQAIASEVTAGNASITKLVSKGDFLRAVAMAKDVQKKIYNAQLILAGQKPK